MMSFQPKHIDSSEINATPAPTAKVNKAPQPVGKVAEPAPEVMQTVQKPPPQETEQATSPASSQAVIELTSNNWPEFVANINLTAMSRQLADNCAFIKIEAKNIHLSIAPELAHLATTNTKDRLEKVLRQHLNPDIIVSINQGTDQHNAQQTLATEQAVERTNKQQQAADSIHNDPAVNALKQAFDAQVIESTIKPI